MVQLKTYQEVDLFGDGESMYIEKSKRLTIYDGVTPKKSKFMAY
jgi:hypothetical protein